MREFFYLFLTMAAVLALSACTLEQTCSDGDKSCDGSTLLTCSRDGDWVEALNCGNNAAFCDVIKGCVECRGSEDCSAAKPICNLNTKNCQSVDAVCGKGEMRCDGNALSRCNAAENAFDKTICVDLAPYCDEAKGCIECRDDKDCSDPQPICHAKLKVCQSANAVCAKGEAKCESDVLTACSSDGLWENSGTACLKGCNALGNACSVCVKGESKCEEGEVYTCSAGNWTESMIACRYGCTIDGTACSICAKNETKCEGNVYKTCNAEQSGFKETACVGATSYCDDSLGCVSCMHNDHCGEPTPVCNMTTHTCQPADAICAQGQTKCENSTLYSCSVDGDWLTPGSPCAVGPKVCNAPGNACSVCVKGETMCKSNVFQLCDDTQTFFNVTSCVGTKPFCDKTKGCVECLYGRDCASGSCDVTTNICNVLCIPGDKLCKLERVYTCEAGNVWSTGTRCHSGCNTTGTDCR